VLETSFTRVDVTHWVLDVCTTISPQYQDLKEACLFLTQPGILDPSMAVELYVRCGNGEWIYRGCVHCAHPSETLPLQWPTPESGVLPQGPGAVQIGIAIEPMQVAVAKEGSKLGAKEDFAKRVGMDLFRYIESFQTSSMNNEIVVPSNILERWFTKFSGKLRKDSDFLTRSNAFE